MRILRDFPYKHVLVFGLAKSGTATAKLLLSSGIQVRVNDRSNQTTEEIKELIANGADVILGSHPPSALDDIQLIIKNPGIPYKHDIIQLAQKRSIPIITDIELTQLVFPGSITGITGSNGKTTTTRLIEAMLNNDDQEVNVAGNIGTPVCEVAPVAEESSKLVLELSSFQLLGIQTFKPKIAVLLNIYEAHLDYHNSMKNYEHAKFNVFKNQSASDFLVYNQDDEKVREAAMNAKATLIPFSTSQKQPDGAWVQNGMLYYEDKFIIKLDEIVLVGNHHLENILAAVSVAKIHGVSNTAIVKTLTTFVGVKHRLQFVENIQGRLFYNDSKATNILATEKALQSFNRPVILLAGGLDRGNEFDDLIPSLANVKHMIVFGENAEKLISIAHNCDITTSQVQNVSEAAITAFELSSKGDVILLSPASASWDQYDSFEQRGDMFINTVHKLI